MKHLAIALTVVALSACASVHSQRIDGKGDGMVYFLPQQDFILTISQATEQGKPTKITSAKFSMTPAYADLKHQYVATAAGTFLTRNTAVVNVDANGLLDTEQNSTVASQVNEALQALAQAAGSIKAASKSFDKINCVDGDNVFVFEPPLTLATHDWCGITVLVEKIGPVIGTQADFGNDKDAQGEKAGCLGEFADIRSGANATPEGAVTCGGQVLEGLSSASAQFVIRRPNLPSRPQDVYPCRESHRDRSRTLSGIRPDQGTVDASRCCESGFANPARVHDARGDRVGTGSTYRFNFSSLPARIAAVQGSDD